MALETSHDFFVLVVAPRYLELFLGTSSDDLLVKTHSCSGLIASACRCLQRPSALLGSGALSGTALCPLLDIIYVCFWTFVSHPKTDIRSSQNRHKPSMPIPTLFPFIILTSRTRSIGIQPSLVIFSSTNSQYVWWKTSWHQKFTWTRCGGIS